MIDEVSAHEPSTINIKFKFLTSFTMIALALMILGIINFFINFTSLTPLVSDHALFTLAMWLFVFLLGVLIIAIELNNKRKKNKKNKKEFSADDLYKFKVVVWIQTLKVIIQFIIGFALILTLTLKGSLEFYDTFYDLKDTEFSKVYQHFLKIDTFAYIGSALAISAGLDLGYMLFTKGPDEALEPLLLGITSAGFYTISDNPNGSWVLGIYAISILVLIFSIKKYRDWRLGEDGKIDEN